MVLDQKRPMHIVGKKKMDLEVFEKSTYKNKINGRELREMITGPAPDFNIGSYEIRWGVFWLWVTDEL